MNKPSQNTGREKEIVLAKTLEFKGINGPLEAKIMKTEKSMFRGGNAIYVFKTDKDITVFQINNCVMFLSKGNVIEDYSAKQIKSGELLEIIKNIRNNTMEASAGNISREMDMANINDFLPNKSQSLVTRIIDSVSRILFGKASENSIKADKKRIVIIEKMASEIDDALGYYITIKEETQEHSGFIKNLVNIRLELNKILNHLKNSLNSQAETNKNMGLVTK